MDFQKKQANFQNFLLRPFSGDFNFYQKKVTTLFFESCHLMNINPNSMTLKHEIDPVYKKKSIKIFKKFIRNRQLIFAAQSYSDCSNNRPSHKELQQILRLIFLITTVIEPWFFFTLNQDHFNLWIKYVLT